MRKQFFKRRLFGRKWKFRGEDLTERAENINNPARGWYQIYTFEADKEPDYKELRCCLDKKDTLALLMIDIGGYKDRPLDDECLERMRKILQLFGLSQYDVILRVAYDHEGRAMTKEPYLWGTVKGHLIQVTELVAEFADTVFVYQGMLVGNWGEMHTSRFLGGDMLKNMSDILCKGKKEQTFLAVRRPVQWRMVHNGSAAEGLKNFDGMGLFDDGMFGSENHLGTYGVEPKEISGWFDSWCREDEMEFIEKLTRTVPNGGEAVYPEGEEKPVTADAVLHDLRTMHITYLNRAHDKKLLELWKRQVCRESGVWAKKSLYEYVGAHLGYRFVIKKAGVLYKRVQDKTGVLQIIIQNTGFAPLYQDALCYLECVDNDGSRQVEVLDYHMKGWQSGECRTYDFSLKQSECAIYLSAKREKDGRAICFANGSVREEKIKLGTVLHV